jgi:hypothetical protein
MNCELEKKRSGGFCVRVLQKMCQQNVRKGNSFMRKAARRDAIKSRK